MTLCINIVSAIGITMPLNFKYLLQSSPQYNASPQYKYREKCMCLYFHFPPLEKKSPQIDVERASN
jgi:hypothetical protein